MYPKISVIVPVYQVESFIEETMRSLARQNFTDFEIILVNDGTKDRSIDVAKLILEKSKLNFIIINQVNKGVSASRNVGIMNAKGDWIVCIDSDDYIDENFLKILYNNTKNNNSDVSIVNFQYIKENTKVKKLSRNFENKVIKQKDILKLFLTRKIKIIIPGMLIKKSFIIQNNLYYNEKMKFSEDQHYIWRVLFLLEKCIFNNAPLYNYVVRSNSTMTSSNVDKIVTGYNGFLELSNALEDDKILNLIFPRWILGTLRAAAKMMPYSEFKKLSMKLDYKKNTKGLIKFPSVFTVLIYLILITNLKLFYNINK